jgi:hypothetical protein
MYLPVSAAEITTFSTKLMRRYSIGFNHITPQSKALLGKLEFSQLVKTICMGAKLGL